LKLSLGLPGAANKKTSYEFEDAVVGGTNSLKGKGVKAAASVECTGTATEKGSPPVTSSGPWTNGTAKVELGKGNLECGIGSEDELAAGTKATIKLTAGTDTWTFESNFKFKATSKLGEIKAELTGKGGVGSATGAANFTGPTADPTLALGCLTSGAKNLNFETASQGGTEIGIGPQIGEE
jgi:hypothetical protein